MCEATTKSIKFKNYEEVEKYAESNDKIILIYNDLILDVTSFSTHHPGGSILLRNNNLKDIKSQMEFHHPLTLTMANTMSIGYFR